MNQIVTLNDRREWLESLINIKKKNKTVLFCKGDDDLIENELWKKKDEIFDLENPDKLFFKYRPLNNYTIDCLKNDEIYLSHPKDFNDPYDSRCYKVEPLTQLDYNDINTYFTQQNQPILQNFWNKKNRKQKLAIASYCRSPDKFIEYLNNHFVTSGSEQPLLCKYDLNDDSTVIGDAELYISCFSSTNKNTLMWSHYAQNHQGVCIGYNYETVKNILYPISYQEEFGNNPDESKIIKSTIWSYEKEWRIVIPEMLAKVLKESYNKHRLDHLKDFRPCSLYLGTKFNRNSETPENEKLMKELISIAKDKNIPIFKMKMKSNRFELYEENYSK